VQRSTLLPLRAFNDDVKAVDRLLQFIRVEKPHFRAEIASVDLVRPYYVIPKMSNRRIIAQSGAFIIWGLSSNGGIDFKKDITADYIVIPQASKALIRTELDGLGINESTLFPEIDRAASYITKRYNG
jgi:hypothetical protein